MMANNTTKAQSSNMGVDSKTAGLDPTCVQHRYGCNEDGSGQSRTELWSESVSTTDRQKGGRTPTEIDTS